MLHYSQASAYDFLSELQPAILKGNSLEMIIKWKILTLSSLELLSIDFAMCRIICPICHGLNESFQNFNIFFSHSPVQSHFYTVPEITLL